MWFFSFWFPLNPVQKQENQLPKRHDPAVTGFSVVGRTWSTVGKKHASPSRAPFGSSPWLRARSGRARMSLWGCLSARVVGNCLALGSWAALPLGTHSDGGFPAGVPSKPTEKGVPSKKNPPHTSCQTWTGNIPKNRKKHKSLTPESTATAGSEHWKDTIANTAKDPTPLRQWHVCVCV